MKLDEFDREALTFVFVLTSLIVLFAFSVVFSFALHVVVGVCCVAFWWVLFGLFVLYQWIDLGDLIDRVKARSDRSD